jgi:hypothetical protein
VKEYIAPPANQQAFRPGKKSKKKSDQHGIPRPRIKPCSVKGINA